MTTTYDQYVTYIFFFNFNNIFKKLFKCSINARKLFYGKFYITKVLEKDKSFKINNITYPSWYEARFYIYEKFDDGSELVYKNFKFCDHTESFIVFASFLIFLIFITLLEICNKMKMIRGRRSIHTRSEMQEGI